VSVQNLMMVLSPPFVGGQAESLTALSSAWLLQCSCEEQLGTGGGDLDSWCLPHAPEALL